jgi:uncharacterized protein with HEPN domain
MNRDLLWLTYMNECLERTARYCAGGRSTLADGSPTRDAVLRNLQVLADTAERLHWELRERHSAVGWEGLRNLRNLLVHESLSLDDDALWEVAVLDLPVLKAAVAEMLSEVQPH